MELNCLIVDDEPLALDLLESYVQRTSFLHLKGRCGSAVDVLQKLKEERIDLIFLDIQMPELTGLELSRMIEQQVRIIFTTAFEQYALEGFKVNALDYLLKPISYPEFLKAANKALQWFEMKSSAQTAGKQEDGCIFVKSDYRLLKIALQKICYIEGLKDYVKIYTEDSPHPVVSLISMKSLEESLPADSFIRVHRSFIVNLDKVAVVERNRIVFGSTYIPVSDSYRDKFLEFINRKTVK
ncbi:MAG: LytTR family DNA-binding domain-containing protein [Odoribacter sp.]|nr:LytTR family DNA-binding domain-containing protein [Odoribacter sp.]